MKQEYKEIENILNVVKLKIDAHLKFKEAYNKQLAFDFSLFQFFNIGENKISNVLAFFLDIYGNHGQGDVFLKEFLKDFYKKEIEIKQLENVCEKVITNGRRLDVFIQLEGLSIAIENKVWADDQNNQLKDYSTYLETKSKGQYLLLYLNPYGEDPKLKSIDEKQKKILIDNNKLKIIGYKQDIIPLINKWLAICEADNVSHFLKEFKKYLEIKFLGKNTLNMAKELRKIILENKREVKHLLNEYKQIEQEVIDKINEVGKKLNETETTSFSDLEIAKVGPKNYYSHRYYKWGISKNGNIIWAQIINEGIDLIFDYWITMEEKTKGEFEVILSDMEFKRRVNTGDYSKNTSELCDFFLNQVKIISESFTKYESK